MDLKQLRIFTAVADHASFTKAAIALDFSQSHITTQVRRLEQGLGVLLFDRRGRSVRLTEQGRLLTDYARRLQSLADEAEVVMRSSGSRGALSIAAHESLAIYRLPELLYRFRELSPDVDIDIKPIDEPGISKAVRSGTVDAALIYTSGQQDLANAITLNQEQPIVVCSPSHPLAGARRLTLRDVRIFDALVTARPCPARLRFDEMLERFTTSDARLREMSNIEAIKQYASHDLGYAVLPRITVAQELSVGTLIELHPPRQLDTITSTLLLSPKRSSDLTAFIEAALAHSSLPRKHWRTPQKTAV